MEGTLAVCLVLLAVALRSRGGRSVRRDLLFGVVLGAAALTRPELLTLVLVYLIVDLRTAFGRSRLLWWLPVLLLLGGLWFGFSIWKTGLWLPATGSAKSAGFDLSIAAWWRVLWREARIIGAAHAVEVVGLLACMVAGIALGRRRPYLPQTWRSHWLLPYATFSLLLPLSFVLSDLQVQPRYLLPLLPCFTLLGFLAWRRLLGATTVVAATLCALCLLWSVGASQLRVHATTMAFSRGLQAALLPLIDIMQARGGARFVACPDIGVIGYRGRMRVADLGGLIDPRFQEWTRQYGYDAMLTEGVFLDAGPVDYLIDRSETPARFAGIVTRGRRWTPLETTLLDNLGLSRPGPFYYTLYALESVDHR
jgi:hypothetical protein